MTEKLAPGWNGGDIYTDIDERLLILSKKPDFTRYRIISEFNLYKDDKTYVIQVAKTLDDIFHVIQRGSTLEPVRFGSFEDADAAMQMACMKLMQIQCPQGPNFDEEGDE